MTQGLVSVIVAAYNAERLLPRCLDSLMAQTYPRLEIIIINDASTDNTQAVIDRYAARDSRILPLRMPVNSGAPAARNEGMKHTTGEFMVMVDADDKIAPDTIELCIRDFNDHPDVDFVTFQMLFVNPHTEEITPFKTNPQVPELMTGEEACYWSILYDFAPNGMSRSPLEQSMPAKAEYGQHSDETVTHLVMLKARKVKLGQGAYYYYQEPTSVTHNVSPKRLEILESRILLKEELERCCVPDKLLRRLEIRRWREFIDMCYFYWKHKAQFTPFEQQDAWTRLRTTYDTFSFLRLPLATVLKPRFMMLPTFKLFYQQLAITFAFGLIRIK